MDLTTLFVLLGMIGPWQIAIIVIVVVLLFGGKKIPELFKGVGQGLKEFKEATGSKDKESTQEKTQENK